MERVSNTPRASSETTSGAVALAGAPKLLDRVRQSIRAKHYSRRTESAYVDWIRRFVFHGKRHPSDMGASAAGGEEPWLHGAWELYDICAHNGRQGYLDSGHEGGHRLDSADQCQSGETRRVE
jgi:hypothetical protein